MAIEPRRITVLWALVATTPIAAIGVAAASRQDALTTPRSPLVDAAREGHRLAWLLLLLVPLSAALAWIAHRVARHVSVGVGTRRVVAGALAACAIGAVAVAIAAAGGPGSALNEVRDRFEAAPAAGPTLNDRLFTFSGTGRAETVRVAWDAGLDHPVAGAGAGTYQILWYENRQARQIVRDAHSLYVETFAELGIVGLSLLVTALVVPLAAAVRARRSRFVAPACGAYLTWVSAAALDWHWEMVGLTMTAFLAGAAGLVTVERRQRGSLLLGSRLALVGVTATLSVFSVWILVGNQALAAAQDAVEDEEWAEARDHARRAQALLVWSPEPEFALGDAYAGLGDRQRALDVLRDGADTDPENWIAWYRIALVARGAERDAALDRVRELNPLFEGRPGA